ncbi:hypothetical protein FKW77_009073 [Neofusicoccum parvum]|nr:hypothetical protein FKW77_009073 [Neofusicoccum parvum]
MASFEGLPDELVERILAYFDVFNINSWGSGHRLEVTEDWRSSIADLRSLLFASKRFHTIVEPHLYRVFCVDSEPKLLTSYINRLIARPDLAKKLKAVYLAGWGDRIEGSYVDDEGREEKICPFEGDGWRKVAMEAGFKPKQQTHFVDELSRGCLSAITVLLFVLATNIVILDAEIPCEDEPWLSRFVQRQVELYCSAAAASDGPLQKIQNVEFRHWDTEMGFDLNLLIPFLNIPSIRTIGGHQCCGRWGADAAVRWPAGASNLTELILEYSTISDVEVGRILECSKNLKTFAYRLAPASVSDNEPDFNELSRAISCRSDTLEYLTLDIRDYDMLEIIGDGPPPTISLRHFTKLKYLEISQCLLIPSLELDEDPEDLELEDDPAEYRRCVENLPPSLEELEVVSSFWDFEDPRDILRFVRMLLPAHPGATPPLPELRKIDIRELFAQRVHSTAFPLLATATKALFKQAGVKFLHYKDYKVPELA